MPSWMALFCTAVAVRPSSRAISRIDLCSAANALIRSNSAAVHGFRMFGREEVFMARRPLQGFCVRYPGGLQAPWDFRTRSVQNAGASQRSTEKQRTRVQRSRCAESVIRRDQDRRERPSFRLWSACADDVRRAGRAGEGCGSVQWQLIARVAKLRITNRAHIHRSAYHIAAPQNGNLRRLGRDAMCKTEQTEVLAETTCRRE